MRQLTTPVAAVALTFGFIAAGLSYNSAAEPAVALNPAASHATQPPGDPRRGAQLYEQRCAGCHSPDADRVGPRHNGVVGRRVGSVPGFAYSKALAQASFKWDPVSLNAWLSNPEKLLPGQRMDYSVSNASDRADLIAYLSTLTAK